MLARGDPRPLSHRRQLGPDHIGIDAGLAERRAQLRHVDIRGLRVAHFNLETAVDRYAPLACRANLSAGYAKLDPALPAVRLATAWRVWVPATELREAKR